MLISKTQLSSKWTQAIHDLEDPAIRWQLYSFLRMAGLDTQFWTSGKIFTCSCQGPWVQLSKIDKIDQKCFSSSEHALTQTLPLRIPDFIFVAEQRVRAIAAIVMLTEITTKLILEQELQTIGHSWKTGEEFTKCQAMLLGTLEIILKT